MIDPGLYYPIKLDLLPGNWSVCYVGDFITDIQPGFASGVHNQEGRGVPHLRPMNIDRDGHIDFSIIKFVEDLSGPRLRRGDILFNNTNSPELIGKTTVINRDEDWAFSNHMTRLRPSGNISSEFIAHQLHFLWMSGYFKHRCVKHVNQASISSSTLAKSIPLILPPVSEQSRLVAEIEKQFTRLEAGVAALHRVQANLKRYRAAVLKAACEGRLVPTEAELARQEGRSYETGAQLLARILEERRAVWERQPGWKKKYSEPQLSNTDQFPMLPKGWSKTLLAPLLSINRVGMKTGPFGSLLKKHEHRSEGVSVLGIENISKMKFIQGNKIFIDAEKASQLATYDVVGGDILISRSGTVGEVCVVPPMLGEARISCNLMRISLQPNGTLPMFFCILFNGSPSVLGQIAELCKGSTRDFLNQDILSLVVFPLPPLPEQHRIVAEVERRLSVIEELEVVVKTNLQRAQRLRQSILQQAFSGKLVTTDGTDNADKEAEQLELPLEISA